MNNKNQHYSVDLIIFNLLIVSINSAANAISSIFRHKHELQQQTAVAAVNKIDRLN